MTIIQYAISFAIFCFWWREVVKYRSLLDDYSNLKHGYELKRLDIDRLENEVRGLKKSLKDGCDNYASLKDQFLTLAGKYGYLKAQLCKLGSEETVVDIEDLGE